MSDVAIIGPVGIRQMHLEKTCEAHVGHEHNYDHTTIVIRGRIKVLYRYVRDGEEIEGESDEFGPGETIHIRAKVRHTIKALEDGSLWYCVFSHRDFGGLVTQEYIGNQAAYI